MCVIVNRAVLKQICFTAITHCMLIYEGCSFDENVLTYSDNMMIYSRKLVLHILEMWFWGENYWAYLIHERWIMNKMKIDILHERFRVY